MQETSIDDSNIKDEVGSNCSYSKSEINAEVLKDEEMKEFREAEYQKVMIGPKLKLGGITLALTIYPMGWSKRGYMGCYLELIEKPDDRIESIQASVTIWMKELGLVYKAARAFFTPGAGIGILTTMYKHQDIKKMDNSFKLGVLLVMMRIID